MAADSNAAPGAGVPQAAYIYEPSMSRHVLRGDHPMRPVRLQLTFELLQALGAFHDDDSVLMEPRRATMPELLSFHTPEYVEAVHRLSLGGMKDDADRYGFSEAGDNPIHKGMYEAALQSTGASVLAAELVADGLVRTAFSPAGGLHHAMAGNASGFCVFDDPVIAINALRRRGLRVAYVDIDAHHGDGVQAAFYGDTDVLTISLHESGQYLFPGTGSTDEQGDGTAKGYAVNVPLFPLTGDDVYLEAFQAVVPPLVRAFKPDILATQLGIDTYIRDPLTHLALTTRGYVRLVEVFAEMGYPWLAFGGGGYDLDAVARCWALAYGVMLGREWPDEVPQAMADVLPSRQLRDAAPPLNEASQEQARHFALEGVEAIQRIIFPLHGI